MKIDNKMNRIGEYKYHVVKFLDNPFKETGRVSCDDVCVPKSWVTWCSPEDNIVRVWYPTQDPSNTENKVRKREKKSEQWESFLSLLKYSTNIYEEAKMYIRNKKYSEKNNKEDHTPLSAKVEGRSCKTTTSVIQNKATVENMLDAIGWNIFSKSANTITLKRMAPADSDKATRKKRSRVNETGRSFSEAAGPSSQPFINETLTHKGSNESPVVKSNDTNSTEKKQIVNQNASKANHSFDPKSVVQLQIFDKCCKLILELQKCLGYSLVRDIINKLMNTDNSRSVLTDDTTASASSDTTVQAPELNEEERNEEQTRDNDSDDENCDHNDCDDANNIDEPRTEQKCSKQLNTFVLPPEYDANDSRWTLQYREPAPELFELKENSGVYVHATRLKTGLALSNETDHLCVLLLTEVFTASALRTCSWTGQKPPGSNGRNVRPGLDTHAREVLLGFAIGNIEEDDGSEIPEHKLSYYRKQFKDTMYSHMLRMRAKTSKSP